MLEHVNTALEVAHHMDDDFIVEIGQLPKSIVWEDGKVKLYHFDRSTNHGVKTPVLIVYALVNRWEMMDLQPDLSFIRKLSEEGLDVYLIEWGYTTTLDRFKTMEEYISGNINDCVEHIKTTHGIEKVNLMGVCQGGTFSLIYSALYPHKIKNLITLVTPVDFTEDKGLLYRWAKNMNVDDLVQSFNGVIPGNFLNVGFDLLKPMNKVRKYLNFSKIASQKDSLLNFLRMEKWVADSPSQAGEAYKTFIKCFYQKNELIKGEFKLGDKKVNLKNIKVPMLTIYAKEDHIVSPASTIPVHEAVSSTDKELMEFPGGHIGVFVGKRSQQLLAPAIASWLHHRDKNFSLN